MSETNSSRAWGPSIDRKDNTKGYTPANCRVVCWMFNAAKGVSSDEDVQRFAHALILHNQNKTPAREQA